MYPSVSIAQRGRRSNASGHRGSAVNRISRRTPPRSASRQPTALPPTARWVVATLCALLGLSALLAGATGAGVVEAAGPSTGRFLQYAGNEPVTWPCGPIRYRIDRAGLPRGARALVRSVIAETSRLSGLEFEQDKAARGVSVAGSETYQGITIAWIDDGRGVDFGSADTLGVGGIRSSGVIESGQVWMRRSWEGSSDTSPGGAAESVLRHELGHALGLAHTDDSTSVMYPLDQSLPQWSQEDRAVLRKLTATACGDRS